MKKPALLLLSFLAASLSWSSAMAEPSPAESGPRPGTVEAMKCLVRQGPAGCEKMFRGSAWVAARPWVFENPNRDFKRGALVSSDFWGRASDSNIYDARIMINQPATEMDIFNVRFDHIKYSFYISPADAEGKIRAVAIRLYEPHDPLQLSGTP
jgi:hypothetical protein